MTEPLLKYYSYIEIMTVKCLLNPNDFSIK